MQTSFLFYRLKASEDNGEDDITNKNHQKVEKEALVSFINYIYSSIKCEIIKII